MELENFAVKTGALFKKEGSLYNASKQFNF